MNIVSHTQSHDISGSYIDSILMNEILRLFQTKHPELKSPKYSSQSLSILRSRCETVKIELSQNETSHIHIPSFYNNIDLDETIDISSFGNYFI